MRRLLIASVLAAIPFFTAQSAEPLPCNPTLLPGEYADCNFDLYRGSGTKFSGCMFVAFGPGIKPEDLDVRYVKENSFEIAIKGTNDVLVCNGFYSPGRRSSAPYANFRFYDANRWTFDDIDKRANVRGLATDTERPSDPGGCVVNGVSYPDSACPAVRLPGLKPGRWQVTEKPEHCGDPLEEIRMGLASLDDLRNFGCTMTTSSTKARTTVVVDCPATVVSADGSRTAPKGRTLISVSSPNPQSFIFELKNRDEPLMRATGTRVGDC